MRDIERKTAGNAAQQRIFADELALAKRLLAQQKQDKNKLYSLHAPEVDCISKGKVQKRYDKSSGQTIYKVHPVLCPFGASLALLDCSNLFRTNLCTAQAARRVAPRVGAMNSG